jgi:predicted transcriptional regulator
MRLDEIVRALGLTVCAGEEGLDRVVRGGYVGDLMSDAIARAPEGFVWITIQTHANVVAVALMKELAGIIVAGGRKPETEALERARREGIAVLSTSSMAFEVVYRLHDLGIAGTADARGA